MLKKIFFWVILYAMSGAGDSAFAFINKYAKEKADYKTQKRKAKENDNEFPRRIKKRQSDFNALDNKSTSLERTRNGTVNDLKKLGVKDAEIDKKIERNSFKKGLSMKDVKKIIQDLRSVYHLSGNSDRLKTDMKVRVTLGLNQMIKPGTDKVIDALTEKNEKILKSLEKIQKENLTLKQFLEEKRKIQREKNKNAMKKSSLQKKKVEKVESDDDDDDDDGDDE